MAYGKNTCIFPCFLHFYPFLFIPVFCFLFLVILLDCSVSFPRSKNYSEKEHFKVQFQPSLSNSQFWIPSRDSPNSNEQFFGGQLFIQFRFTPRLNKVRGSFVLCWRSHQSDSYRKFFVRKSGTLRWHMEKTPAFFLVFFAFPSIPLHSRFLFLIPCYSFVSFL